MERYAARRAGPVGGAAPLAIEDAPYPVLDPTTIRREYKNSQVLTDLTDKVRAAQARSARRNSNQPFSIQLLLHESIPHLLQLASSLKSKSVQNFYRLQLDALLRDMRENHLTADSVEAIDDLTNTIVRNLNEGR